MTESWQPVRVDVRRRWLERDRDTLCLGLKIGTDTSFPRSLRKLARQQLSRACELEDDARIGNVEAVHHLRATLRRMRTLFLLCEGDKAAKRLRRRSGEFANLLGAVRDLDVMIQRIRDAVADGGLPPDDMVRGWLAALEAEREKARQVLDKKLRSPRFARWHTAVKTWSESGGKGAVIGDKLPEVLSKQVRTALADWPPASEASLHRLRIEIKRVRYLLEFYKPALSEEAGPAIELLTKAQDAIGEHRDQLNLAARAEAEAGRASGTGLDPQILRAYAARLNTAIPEDTVQLAKDSLAAAAAVRLEASPSVE